MKNTRHGWSGSLVGLLVVASVMLAGCSASKPMAHPYSLEDRVRDAAAAGVAPDNLPIYRPTNSNSAVLLLHGFRSTPWQMGLLADEFTKRGYTVYAPLLPGHGTSPEALDTTTWKEWEDEAFGAYRALKQSHEKVYVAGLSTGGVLALRVAEKEHPDAAISINSPVWLRERGADLAWLLKYFKKETIRPVEDDPVHYYDRIPLSAIAELGELVAVTYRAVPRIRSPVLVIQTVDDETVLPESGKAIYRKLHTEKEFFPREGTEHVITREPDVVRKVVEYVRDH